MGNCCSTISKKKRKSKPEEVYDPEESSQKMISNEDSKKELSSFDSEYVKRALGQDAHTIVDGDDYDDSSSDDNGNAPKTNAKTSRQQNKTMGILVLVRCCAHCLQSGKDQHPTKYSRDLRNQYQQYHNTCCGRDFHGRSTTPPRLCI